MHINAHSYVHPVQAGIYNGDRFNIREVIGSAFSIGGGYFITCAHVFDNLLENEIVSIGTPNTEFKSWQALPVSQHELHKDADIALIHCPKFGDAKSRTWCNSEDLMMLCDVTATGFPYALNAPDEGSIQIRSFKGYVSSSTNWKALASNPNVYELSFQAPRGLSGAPLVTDNKIGGVIFGNRSIEMIVHSEEEIDIDSSTTSIYEKTESYRAGLAIQNKSIISLESKILACSISEHLKKQQLL